MIVYLSDLGITEKRDFGLTAKYGNNKPIRLNDNVKLLMTFF